MEQLPPVPVSIIDIDHLLKLQLVVAWAGEADTDPSRLGWWRTSMTDEYGGEDLLRRLTPKTWQWATLEVARAAAKKVDAQRRAHGDDPDRIISLYRFGFDVDERLDDRLLQLKQSGQSPVETFSELEELMAEWSDDAFSAWVGRQEEAAYTTTATGRRLRGEMPESLSDRALRLVSALLPLADHYPLPYFRLSS